MNAFPADLREWKNDVARRLMALRGNVNDIFMTMPQIPDPEIGMPFSGPLSPVPFVWPNIDRSGGTLNTGGTPGTGGTGFNCAACPAVSNRYSLVVAGATNNICTECAELNTSFVLDAVAACQWDSARFPMCPATLASGTIGPFWRITFSAGTTTLQLRGNTIFGNPTVIAIYTYAGCPPPSNSGSGGTITMSYVSGGTCNFPATVSVTAI